MKSKYIFGVIIIVGFIIWAGISFNKTLTPYVSIAEAKSSASVVQVKGQRADNGTFDTTNNLFTFNLIDEKGDKITVVYDGAKPEMLKDEAQAILAGTLDEAGVFIAEELLLKCPSKYEEVNE